MSPAPAEETDKVRSTRWASFLQGCAYVAAGLGLGAAGGIAWWGLVDLPTYQVGTTGGASTTERGLTEYISGDAWFVVIGLVVGVALGVLGWRTLSRIGWPLVALTVGTAFAAGLLCWFVGFHLGPGEFNRRLADAQPGDLVPIELTLRARASLLTWPFFAVVPLLLVSSLGRDDEEPTPLRRRRPAS